MNLKEQFEKAMADAKAVCDKVQAENRDFTDAERDQAKALYEQAKDLKKKIDDNNAVRQSLADLGVGLGTKDGDGRRADPSAQAKGLTLGDQFVSSKVFQDWYKSVAPGGLIPDGFKHFNSPAVQLKGFGFKGMGRKTLITGADPTQAGVFVQTDWTGIYEPLGRIPLTLGALINHRSTTSDLVYFIRQVHQVTQAAPVPEANIKEYSGATGEIEGAKPQGAVEFVGMTEPVKTIAVWIAATKRALSDAAQIRGIIDDELSSDVREELENQIINGNGVGENFTGVVQTAGIQVQAWNTDFFTTTRQALTLCKVTGRAMPTAWLMNPTDVETLDLLQDAINHYYFGGPYATGPKTLWGYPIVENQQLAAGSALLADWQKATLWDREAVNLSVTDSHADFFIRNLVAFLAEGRWAFGIRRPAAFVQVDLTP